MYEMHPALFLKARVLHQRSTKVVDLRLLCDELKSEVAAALARMEMQ
jgi:hypothetical protein